MDWKRWEGVYTQTYVRPIKSPKYPQKQSQDISIPLDRAVLRRDGMTINAELENGKNYLLGAYESEEAAQEEFNRVSALIGAGHLNIILGS